MKKTNTTTYDSLGSLILTSNPGTACKKKMSHISCHFVRKANTAGIVKIKKWN